MGIEFTNSVVMNDEVASNKVIPRSEGFIYRRFVTPYGGTPNLFRLYYLPKHSRKMRKNYGYKLIAHHPMDESTFRKKHKLTHNFIVDPDK